jgi:hypothetical protein
MVARVELQRLLARVNVWQRAAGYSRSAQVRRHPVRRHRHSS